MIRWHGVAVPEHRLEPQTLFTHGSALQHSLATWHVCPSGTQWSLHQPVMLQIPVQQSDCCVQLAPYGLQVESAAPEPASDDDRSLEHAPCASATASSNIRTRRA
jgi:hypothetical protein